MSSGTGDNDEAVGSGMVDVEQALDALESVLGRPDPQRATLLNAPDTLAAVETLTRATGDGDGEPGLRVWRALGWWHELTSHATTDPGEADAHRAAAAGLLLPVYRAAPGNVPDRLRHEYETTARAAHDQAAVLYQRITEGDPGVDIDAMIRAFHMVVDLTPAGHPDRAGRLSSLGVGLQARYGRTGHLPDLEEAIQDWREAVEATPPGHPDRAMYLSNLAGGLHARYGRTGHLPDLEEAIQAWREALEATPPGHPNRAGRQSNLAGGLQTRYERTGHLPDLKEAIQVGREAVEATPPGHPNRAGRQSNLAVGLQARYGRTGHLPDLEEAIQVGREALEATPTGHPNRARHLSNLAGGLHARYEHTGHLPDLEEAIQDYREAVEATPPGHPDRAMYLSRFAGGLHARYERTGHLPDLEEAIQDYREALEATPPGHPDRAMYLSRFAVGLRTRYERAGHLPDLEEAIQDWRDAVEATPPGHPDWAGRLSNLAVGLQARYGRTGHLPDLEEAIQACRDAVEATPTGHPDRAGRLSNLSAGLQTRYENTGHLPDLDEAIQDYREALEATPPGHPNRARRLSNLAAGLHARYENTVHLPDLEEAIQVGREAVEATPAGHPNRAGRQSNLGIGLHARYEHAGDDGDRVGAVAAFREAATDPVAPPVRACRAARSWGGLVSGRDAVGAFETAVGLLPRVAPRWLGYADVVGHAGPLTGLGADAAAAFLEAGDARGALQVVEQARAVAFSHVLQSRTDLTGLEHAHPVLAGRVRHLLAVVNQDTPVVEETGGGSQAWLARRRTAAADLGQVLDQVRALGGEWERFFLPPSVEDLRGIASRVGGVIVTVVVAQRRCDALVLTSEGVHSIRLPGLTLDDAVENANRLLGAIDTLSNGNALRAEREGAGETLTGVCRWLWDAVAGPVLDDLDLREPGSGRKYDGWPRVWWVPTGPLTVLPLHAAGYHDGSGRAVIDRVVSSTIPTIDALRPRPRRMPVDGRDGRVLLVGMTSTPGASDLPGVADELDVVKSHLAGVEVDELMASPQGEPATDQVPVSDRGRVRADSGAKAPTKARVRKLLPEAAWAHLACHAQTDARNPVHSRLLLTDHQTDPFTVQDLTSTVTNTGRMLFLSACTTARPGLRAVDEPAHLAAAGLLAGYRHVIATMWPLLDHSAVTITDRIYDSLTNAGAPVTWEADHAAVAVHRAVRAQRATNPDDIYRWATHTHHGP